MQFIDANIFLEVLLKQKRNPRMQGLLRARGDWRGHGAYRFHS